MQAKQVQITDPALWPLLDIFWQDHFFLKLNHRKVIMAHIEQKVAQIWSD